MDHLERCSVRYLGYPFSLEFIARLEGYFNRYYGNLFSKVAPVWLKRIASSDLPQNSGVRGFQRFEIEDIDYEGTRNLTCSELGKNTPGTLFKDLVDSYLQDLLDRKLDSKSFDKLRVDLLKKVNVSIVPCLLAIYRTDIYRTFLIFPLFCKIKDDLSISTDFVDFVRSVSRTKISVGELAEAAEVGGAVKIGLLDRLEKEIEEQQRVKVLISVHFNENTDFTLFELNFNNPLNYLPLI